MPIPLLRLGEPFAEAIIAAWFGVSVWFMIGYVIYITHCFNEGFYYYHNTMILK